jgi:hypothetical protein
MCSPSVAADRISSSVYLRVVRLNWLDLFDVYLLNQDGTIKEKISDIYVDSLVSVLDNAIEKVDNYEERVKREYSIQ